MSTSQAQPQPAKAYLALGRITVTGLARQLGRSRHHIGKVLNGHEPPSASLRAEIADLLQESEDKLFRPADPAPRYPGVEAISQREARRRERVEAQGWPVAP